MKEKILTMAQVSKMLGVTEKTCYNLVRHDGLPMVKIGRGYSGYEEDIRLWFRRKYPKKFVSMLSDTNKTQEKHFKVRSQMNGEIVGVAKSGSSEFIVRGKEFIALLFNKGKRGKVQLESIRMEGNYNATHSQREPVIFED